MKPTPPLVLKQPELTDQLIPTNVSELVKRDIDDAHISGGVVTGETIKSLTARSSHLEDVELTSSVLKTAFLRDVIYDRGQLFGTNLDSSTLMRVAFNHCLATGLILSAATMKDVTFNGVKLNLTNFREAKLIRVKFKDCDLTEADFQTATLTHVTFDNCTLDRTTFDGAQMSHIDLGNCDLRTLRGLSGLRGVAVNAGQLIQLAPTLAAEAGIKLEDNASPN